MINPKIKSIVARRVFDSRGWPTVEVEISSSSFSERAIVPSGASTGIHEALELRDKTDNNNPYFMNKDVRTAIDNVNLIIAPKLIGMDVLAQQKLDEIMISLDGTENKEKLGSNAILAVSLAIARLSAKERGLPLYKRFTEIAEYQIGKGKIKYPNCLPVPMVNVINGGAHANSNLSIQEFMFVPMGSSFSESIAMASDLFHALQKKIKQSGKSIAVGDEGGIALYLDSYMSKTDNVFELMMKIIGDCHLKGKVKIAIDVAASEIYKGGRYELDGNDMTSDEMISFYENICNKFPIYSIEDGLHEDDWDGWTKMNQRLGDKIMTIGDDLLVTNKKRVEIAVKRNSCNSVLVKLNQIGTVTETISTVGYAYGNGMNCVISHRSGETEDTTIADLSVGLGTRYIKTGSITRGERTAKYNQLLRIEEELGNSARYMEGL